MGALKSKEMDQNNDFVSRSEFESLKELVLAKSPAVSQGQEDKASILVFSGSLDKLLASFIIATSAAASGMETTLFFTFWATSGLKKQNQRQSKKGFLERMFGWMLPRGSNSLPLSQMNMAGIGPKMIRHMMSQKNTSSLEELIEAAGDLGVKIRICEMTMDLIGINEDEIIDYPDLELCGATQFLEVAAKGKLTLFI